MTVAHRFGMRVYLDNIGNHRGFNVPGYDANYLDQPLPRDWSRRISTC